jgi:hypothetical protein
MLLGGLKEFRGRCTPANLGFALWIATSISFRSSAGISDVKIISFQPPSTTALTTMFSMWVDLR